MGSILGKKWRKLLRRSRLFDFIPFVDFVFVAGSMAMGNPEEYSDFDVIVGTRAGRIFTARLYCFILFGLFGWRRVKNASARAAKNKFCFSHFVAPERYRLAGPHNEYWKRLYRSVIPVYGSPEIIQKFYDVNADWMGGQRVYVNDGRNFYEKKGLFKKIWEKILSGKLGNAIENILKKIQIKRIEKSLKSERLYKPRIIYTDSELEFHPDTKRIEDLLNSGKI